MMLTGEIYDARAIVKLFAALRETIASDVSDAAHRRQALQAVDGFERAFETHRKQLDEFGECVRKADKKLDSTRSDYAACAERAEAQRTELRRTLALVEREYEAALSPAEHERVAQALEARSEARVLDPRIFAEKSQKRAARRSRGIEGIAAQRHLTLPRNVVSIIYGPLLPSTFGQRFPSRIIDAGTSYTRHEGSTGASTTRDWYTRIGVRFGLLDDLEVNVLVPFELAPELALDPTLIAFTNQFRLGKVDLALRFSFQTPGDPGWALAPGILARVHSKRLALQAGIFAPMEVGTVRDPVDPSYGFNAPVRVIFNVLPALYVTGETGLVYDDFRASDAWTLPLAFGTGYTALFGSKLLELTGSFSWDQFLRPARQNDTDALDYKSFRVTFGATFSFKAL